MERNRVLLPLVRIGIIGLLLSLVVSLAPMRALAGDFSEQQQLVNRARMTFERFLAEPGIGAWHRTEAKNVKAVFIVPQLLRGSFLVGAAGGSGVLLARDFVKGGWSPPAFYKMSAASFGPQIGADASEIVLMITTFSALERFHGLGTAKLGLDAGFTVGPLGEGGTTGLDVVSFAWSKGVYAGMSLEGVGIMAATGDNEAYYGGPVKPEQILSNGPITNPKADELRRTVGQLIK